LQAFRSAATGLGGNQQTRKTARSAALAERLAAVSGIANVALAPLRRRANLRLVA
jgi:hypothetical protein